VFSTAGEYPSILSASSYTVDRDTVRRFVCDKRGRNISGVNYEAYRSVVEAKGRFLEACYSGHVAVLTEDDRELEL
jgi:hypothetical protein